MTKEEKSRIWKATKAKMLFTRRFGFFDVIWSKWPVNDEYILYYGMGSMIYCDTRALNWYQEMDDRYS